MYAPYYLATVRGFYAAKKVATAEELIEAGGLYFTSNIRRATPFDNFNQAEQHFQFLLAASKESKSFKLDSGYFAILAAPSMRMENGHAMIVTTKVKESV